MLAADMGWKLLDFFWGGGEGGWGGVFFNYNSEIFGFWHFSITYNVKFT